MNNIPIPTKNYKNNRQAIRFKKHVDTTYQDYQKGIAYKNQYSKMSCPQVVGKSLL